MAGSQDDGLLPSSVFHRDLINPQSSVERAEGVHVWDSAGTRYLDASSGTNVVVSIGYGVPEVLQAMAEQARKVCFSGGFTSAAQENLAARLAAFAPPTLDYVRFTSGGSESTETAIKLARHYFVESGKPTKSKVIGRWRGYHGNTLGALSASGHVLRRREYEPYMLPFPHVSPPYRYRCKLCAHQTACTLACADELEQTILNEGPDEVAAFIAEPVVGAAAFGMVPDPDYFRRVREICDRYDVLLIVDEVLCGMGRTGRNFAIDHFGVEPDIIACGKGISSGYTPLGAVISTSRIYQTVHHGSGMFEHGFTYGGNPLSAAVGLAVLNYIERHELVARAADIGKYLIDGVRSAVSDHPLVGDIDGLGMLVGIELVENREHKMPFDSSKRIAARLAALCRARGVLITPCFSGNADGVRGDRVGIAPPFVFERSHVDETISAVAAALDELLQEVG